MTQQAYRVPELAKMLGVSKASVYNAIKAGTFPFPVIKIGERYVIPRQPVDAAMNPSSDAA